MILSQLTFGLLNTRSINNKEHTLKDFAVDNNIDIFALTDTWLRKNYKFSTAEICPAEYYVYHIPRKNSRGGGLSFLLKNALKLKTKIKIYCQLSA